jgi:hypothetical protein
MKKYISIFLLLFSVSCTSTQDLELSTPSLNKLSTTNNLQAENTPNELPSATRKTTQISTVNSSPSPKFTNTPILSPTLTKTVFPPLDANISYLMYHAHDGYVILNPDGSGRQTLQMQADGWTDSFSPDGRWAVKSSCEDDHDLLKCNTDLSLTVISIPEGDIRFSWKIYPKEKVDPDNYWDYWIVDWSPNGRYLAFAAMPTGLSLDLFVYDTRDNLLHRLTNDSQRIAGIDWSPDSKQIVYWNVLPCSNEYPDCEINAPEDLNEYSINVTQPENGSNQGIRTLINRVGLNHNAVHFSDSRGWLSSEQYVLAWGCSDRGSCGSLSYIDINTGQETNISTGLEYARGMEHTMDNIMSFGEFVPELFTIDPVNKVTLLYDMTSESWKIVSFKGDILHLGDIPLGSVSYRGGPLYRFLSLPESRVYGITLSGEYPIISERDHANILPSASGMFVIYNEKGLDIFSINDNLVFSIDNQSIRGILWRPDWKGIYYMTDLSDNAWAIYFLSIPDFQSSLIYKCINTDQECKEGDGLWWIS